MIPTPRCTCAGKKQDYEYRLGASERAGRAGARRLGLGALLGLYDWRIDGFWTALHARYLQKECWQSAISVAFPRLKVSSPRFTVPHLLGDREFVQLMLATRLFLARGRHQPLHPRVGGFARWLNPVGGDHNERWFLDPTRRLFAGQQRHPGTICYGGQAQSGRGNRSHTPGRVRPGLEGF